MHGYRDHIDRYLIPGLGRVTLADLTPRRLHACFDLLAGQRTVPFCPRLGPFRCSLVPGTVKW